MMKTDSQQLATRLQPREPGISDSFVFFGATGDLAYRQIFPALQQMILRDNFNVPIIGVVKSGWTIDQLKARVRDSLTKHGGSMKRPTPSIRPGSPLSLSDTWHLVQAYVEHYNNIRLNSAIGYVTPKDLLGGRQQEIHVERDRKLAEGRQQRPIRRQRAAPRGSLCVCLSQ